MFCGSCPCSKKGKHNKNEQDKNNNNTKEQTKFPCHYCKEFGHYIKDCPKKKKDQENKENEDQDANFCSGGCTNKEESDDDFFPVFALHVDVKEEEEEKKWLLDSACTKHITGDKEDLSNYKKFHEKDESPSRYVT